MSLPIHLVPIVHQGEGWRSKGCSKPRECSICNTPTKSLTTTPVSAHGADDRAYKTVEEQAAHKPRLYRAALPNPRVLGVLSATRRPLVDNYFAVAETVTEE